MASETFRITEEIIVSDKTGQGLESASKKVSAFDKVIEKTQSQLDKMTGSKWALRLDAVDKATQVITAVENRINSAVGKAWNIAVGIKDTFRDRDHNVGSTFSSSGEENG